MLLFSTEIHLQKASQRRLCACINNDFHDQIGADYRHAAQHRRHRHEDDAINDWRACTQAIHFVEPVPNTICILCSVCDFNHWRSANSADLCCRATPPVTSRSNE